MSPTTRRPRRRPALAAGSLLAVLALAGCGGGDAAGGPTTGGPLTGAPAAASPSGAGAGAPAVTPTLSAPAGPHNASDVTFARSMIPHDVQLLASTQIASTRPVRPQVKSLATRISAAQVPQIETLSSWLVRWGVAVPAGAAGASSPGIGSDDLVRLSQAGAGAFEAQWLTAMIAHQQVAVTLAQSEVAHGSSTEAKALATRLLAETRAQIATMKGLLAKKA